MQLKTLSCSLIITFIFCLWPGPSLCTAFGLWWRFFQMRFAVCLLIGKSDAKITNLRGHVSKRTFVPWVFGSLRNSHPAQRFIGTWNVTWDGLMMLVFVGLSGIYTHKHHATFYIPTYLHTYLPTYMHTCIHAYMNTCKHACMHACMHVCMYAMLCYVMYVMYVCMCVCMYVCMDVWMYGCMDVCMYACMHVCMYACMHVCMYACM